jgi:hypothetical protein
MQFTITLKSGAVISVKTDVDLITEFVGLCKASQAFTSNSILTFDNLGVILLDQIAAIQRTDS